MKPISDNGTAGSSGNNQAINHFEYWPPYLFHFPSICVYMILAFRYKSLTLPTIANPGLPDSKCEILDRVPPAFKQWVARYTFFQKPAHHSRPAETAQRLINDLGLNYPLVVKPDLGLRGMGVQCLNNYQKLELYLTRTRGNAALQFQEYIAWPGEAGVFYIRRPGSANGDIVSLAFKSPATVTGDGQSTLKNLILSDERARRIRHVVMNRHRNQLTRVIPNGEHVPLTFALNHTQGGMFSDAGHLVTDALRNRFDAIAQAMPDFYYGRFDVKFENLETFVRGERFKIIEINGALAEPIHYFDAAARLRDVYPHYFSCLSALFEISDFNRRQGHRPTAFKQFIIGQAGILKFIVKNSKRQPHGRCHCKKFKTLMQ